jgi:hypothetical protein
VYLSHSDLELLSVSNIILSRIRFAAPSSSGIPSSRAVVNASADRKNNKTNGVIVNITYLENIIMVNFIFEK